MTPPPKSAANPLTATNRYRLHRPCPGKARLWTLQPKPDYDSEERERAAWDEKGTDRMQWPLSEPWQYAVVPSWEGVFDLQATLEEWGDDIQATFERLEWQDVVAVTEFTARAVR